MPRNVSPLDEKFTVELEIELGNCWTLFINVIPEQLWEYSSFHLSILLSFFFNLARGRETRQRAQTAMLLLQLDSQLVPKMVNN